MAAPMSKIQVKLTNKIKRWIPTVLSQNDLPEEARKQLKLYCTESQNGDSPKYKQIPFSLVKTLHECLQKEQGGLYLHELLEGSDIVYAKKEPQPRSPELEARLEKLRAQQANRDYKEMTKNVDLNHLKKDEYGSIGKEMKTMNNILIAVFNFILTVIGAFTFGYKATEYSLTEPIVPLQIGNGIIAATIVFFADLYFLVKQTA